jgi:deazaflavin-dependent oxidoreductase (nitroreductase family)
VPNIRWLLALITRSHRALYLATNGRLGDRFGRLRFLLLTHTGRRSGRSYTAPLLYLRHEGHFVVVASNAGDDRHPAWWLNLLAQPEAQIQVGRERLVVKTRTAVPEESPRLWALLTAAYAPYDRYRSRTSREIPIVLLERAG